MDLELIDQYTRTVEAAQAVDPDISSSFIEMAAHLVEMKSYLLLPRSTEGERMKQELTGQLIEYDQCRRMASALRAAAEATPTFVRQPMQLERDETYALNHLPQVLADCWESLMGRAPVRRMPTQAVFEPLVTAPHKKLPTKSYLNGVCSLLILLHSVSSSFVKSFVSVKKNFLIHFFEYYSKHCPVSQP